MDGNNDYIYECTHPKYLRFIQEYEAWGTHKKLEMCRNCGRVVSTQIIKEYGAGKK